MARRKHSRAFEKEAVRLIRDQAERVAQASRDLAIYSNSGARSALSWGPRAAGARSNAAPTSSAPAKEKPATDRRQTPSRI